MLVVAQEPLALRASAWVELHAWLATTARAEHVLDDPELDASVRSYARVLADDDDDALLERTSRALEACGDERCARRAVTGTPFAAAYLAVLPAFLERHWTSHAETVRASMEVARSAFGEELTPLAARLARDLAIDWPSAAAIVDVVADAPTPGRKAPIPVLLAAHGTCFGVVRKEPKRMVDVRIIDCALAYAASRLDERSTLASALREELRAQGRARDFTRAWTMLVVHAVAQMVAGLEPKHASVLRRAAASVNPRALAWLANEWPARMRGEAATDFAKRYAAALLDET